MVVESEERCCIGFIYSLYSIFVHLCIALSIGFLINLTITITYITDLTINNQINIIQSDTSLPSINIYLTVLVSLIILYIIAVLILYYDGYLKK